MKNYNALITLPTFAERFEYLRLKGDVGRETFASLRYLNQAFYTSREWRQFRDHIIVRDNGCDLGVPGHEIQGHIILHHIRPLTVEQVYGMDAALMDPDNVITTSFTTHNAIHYGIEMPCYEPIVRMPGDTTLWTRKVPDGRRKEHIEYPQLD